MLTAVSLHFEWIILAFDRTIDPGLLALTKALMYTSENVLCSIILDVDAIKVNATESKVNIEGSTTIV